MDDEDFIKSQIDDMKSYEMTLLEKSWLEVIIGVTKKKYVREQETGWFPKKKNRRMRTQKIEGILKTTPKIGYHISVLGYWVDPNEINQAALYYSR